MEILGYHEPRITVFSLEGNQAMEQVILLILLGTLIVGSTAVLLALCVYIFLVCRGNSSTLLSTIDAGHMTRRGKILVGFAAIGFLVCMYQGAEAMLLWMPDFGAGYKYALAGLFALVGGGALIKFIDQAQRDRFVLVLLQEEVEYERKIHATMSLVRLDELQSDLEGKIEALNRGPHRLGEVTEKYIFGEGVSVASHKEERYRNLIQLVEDRKQLVQKVG